MSTITHITAGRASRLAVAGALAFSYQDSGFESALASGNLDAPEHQPAGSHISAYEIAGRGRNRVAPQLASREFGLTYTVTERTAAGARIYTAIGDAGVLMDAAYDRGALGVTAVVRP